MSSTTSPKAVGSPKTTKPITESPVPDSPTARRLSLGSGNDGAGGQMFKKKRTNSLDKQAAYADQSKSPLYEKFKAFVKGSPDNN